MKVQEYRGKTFIVRFDPKTCIHAARCVTGLPSVFDVQRKPWIDVEGAAPAEIQAQVDACPSGALSFVHVPPDGSPEER